MQIKYEFRNANLSDTAILKRLWSEAFGDSTKNIDRFFDRVYTSNRAFVATSDSKVVAMMFLLNSKLRVHDKAYDAGYIYAVATDTAHRGNGVMKQLEGYVCNVARERGIKVLSLVPATKSLFKMYEKLGYKTVFYKQASIVTPMPCTDYELLSCNADSFLKMREQMLADYNDVFELDETFKRYRFELLEDDDMLLYKDSQDFGYIVGKKNGHSYEIIETNLNLLALSKAVYGLMQKYYKLRKITVIGKNGRLEKYGMLKALDDEVNVYDVMKTNPYMNLMLE